MSSTLTRVFEYIHDGLAELFSDNAEQERIDTRLFEEMDESGSLLPSKEQVVDAMKFTPSPVHHIWYAIVDLESWRKTAGVFDLELVHVPEWAAHKIISGAMIQKHRLEHLDAQGRRNPGYSDPIIDNDHILIKLRHMPFGDRFKMKGSHYQLDPPFNKSHEEWQESIAAYDHKNDKFVLKWEACAKFPKKENEPIENLMTL